MMYQKLANYKKNIFQDNIILVDLDETLVYSNMANNFAYQQAVKQVLHIDFVINNSRITSKNITNFIDISTRELQAIIKYKQKIYPQFIDKTMVNDELKQFLQDIKQICPLYLVTKSEIGRAKQLLEFHQLSELFTDKFFCKNENNKYQYTINKLQHNFQKIFIFEDSEIEIKQALLMQIPQENIFHISQEELK
ncbi:MAG: hypothetical protein KGV51_01590 [Moraxellaceae bacterium]|nr:hypothetical protein [Moraxellaceae bacterium]